MTFCEVKTATQSSPKLTVSATGEKTSDASNCSVEDGLLVACGAPESATKADADLPWPRNVKKMESQDIMPVLLPRRIPLGPRG